MSLDDTSLPVSDDDTGKQDCCVKGNPAYRARHVDSILSMAMDESLLKTLGEEISLLQHCRPWMQHLALPPLPLFRLWCLRLSQLWCSPAGWPRITALEPHWGRSVSPDFLFCLLPMGKPSIAVPSCVQRYLVRALSDTSVHFTLLPLEYFFPPLWRRKKCNLDKER